jgi:hypothetical protein
MSGKMSNTKHNKKKDGHFKKKNIKHGQAESARAVFGKKDENEE